MKWLILILLAVAAFKLFRKPEAIKAKESSEGANAVDTVQDPITGTFVSKDTEYKVKYFEKVYYFSSKESMDRFIAEKKEQA